MYAGSGTLGYYAYRRMRPTGIVFLVLIMVTAVLAMGHPRGPVYQIFAVVLSLVAVGLVWAWSRRARLSVERELPPHGTVGHPIRYRVRVRNLGRRLVQHAFLIETPPSPHPSVAAFYHAREPGEEQRNAFDRFFRYYRWQWLLERRALFQGGAPGESLTIEPGEEVRSTLGFTPVRRGVIVLNDMRVLLPDPFGFFQRCREVVQKPSSITILPKRYRLPLVDFSGTARFEIGGEAASNAIGASGEFIGLREYRPGDSLRQIHWKSWARTGRPIVKELEDNFFPRYGLVLDTFPEPGQEQAFEEAVSVAASFAATLETSESLLDLMFVGEQAHVITAGRGMARADAMLEVLAAVEPAHGTAFDELARLILRHADELSVCICVLCGWSEERARWLSRLEQSGLELRVLCLVDDVEEAREEWRKNPATEKVHWLELGKVQESLLQWQG